MTYEAALQKYEACAAGHAPDYSDETIIRVYLFKTARQGVFELQRKYRSPRILEFKPLRFEGDFFVKKNIIIRLLQSEVDHVEQGEEPLTAISSQNYSFSYKGVQQLDGSAIYVYQLKPRAKRHNLFKGRIFLDAHSGSLRRAEGRPLKSPSFFVKRIEFVQDYADLGGFTLPVHLHAVAETRLLGRVSVEILHRDYQINKIATSDSSVTHNFTEPKSGRTDTARMQ